MIVSMRAGGTLDAALVRHTVLVCMLGALGTLGLLGLGALGLGALGFGALGLGALGLGVLGLGALGLGTLGLGALGFFDLDGRVAALVRLGRTLMMSDALGGGVVSSRRGDDSFSRNQDGRQEEEDGEHLHHVFSMPFLCDGRGAETGGVEIKDEGVEKRIEDERAGKKIQCS
ncbi:hypothetical protein BC937DRAFT_93622 [Endogone sp. FLAS-F59071]|nr:hypothetical protein BC937DRAFT_93622 [Endogone sp. FLAS-F59071]|eukprot:RUS14571.1 hypothetical protein BC937DRAFT_93622 [Endogone sp. FLAS-F59071]